MTLSDPDPDFKITTFLDIEYEYRAIVTIERQQEVVCALSHGDISSDLEGPIARFSRSQTKLLKNTNMKPHTIYRMVPL